jgi:hypothetical protein
MEFVSRDDPATKIGTVFSDPVRRPNFTLRNYSWIKYNRRVYFFRGVFLALEDPPPSNIVIFFNGICGNFDRKALTASRSPDLSPIFINCRSRLYCLAISTHLTPLVILTSVNNCILGMLCKVNDNMSLSVSVLESRVLIPSTTEANLALDCIFFKIVIACGKLTAKATYSGMQPSCDERLLVSRLHCKHRQRTNKKNKLLRPVGFRSPIFELSLFKNVKLS